MDKRLKKYIGAVERATETPEGKDKREQTKKEEPNPEEARGGDAGQDRARKGKRRLNTSIYSQHYIYLGSRPELNFFNPNIQFQSDID